MLIFSIMNALNRRNFADLPYYKYQRINWKPIYSAVKIVHSYPVTLGYGNLANFLEVASWLFADFLFRPHRLNFDAVIRNHNHNVPRKI